MIATTYTSDNHYAELPCSCNDISAYHWAGTDLFVLCLNNREIVRFYPSDTSGFLTWLRTKNIRQVA
ncbi:hypothetical protein MKQ68_11015 [Chitinophaga horti]|uniref:Uncharacterized protein n=1 Tax=Chitinophaga horti TaxID=2920382 RepID=A0ABY6JAP3_9BACT|nr:hypothetical protein [Chitinophaga horti]UYQ95632.1 hypothetical protein MKQ68_11015 [Chitinophaga horti]